MVLDISTGPVQSESAGDLATVSDAEARFIVARAVNVVRREMDCTPHQAIAAICRDWMELREVDILSPNELANSTPVDFVKPSWVQRLRQIF
jgi:hypothetical protein